jgi:putative FmdB family regulatory protein
MPIYAYRCDSCGFAKDVLQKVSDAPLTECPSCHKSEFKKQVTAAGFQLKGTGWYVTDFRGGSGGAPSGGTPSGGASSTAAKPASEGSSSADSVASNTSAPATSSAT